jgi:hypothetical protein
MYEITDKTLKNAHKPFDIVTNKNNDVGFIKEVSLNTCQPNPIHQVQYSVHWIIGSETKCAWFDHCELTYHANLFVEIAKVSCGSFGGSDRDVERLFRNFK